MLGVGAMTRVERFHPGTKVSEWASGAVAAPLPTTHIDNFCYVMGGGSYTDIVDRFLFPDDIRTTLATGLSSGRSAGAGMSNSGTAGYHAGGGTSGNVPVTTVDKLAYSDDARSTLATGLADTRTNIPFGLSNSGTAGYIGGGWSYTGNDVIDKTDKFAFSNDSRSTISDTLVAALSYVSGMANSGTAGYVGAGYTTGNLSRVEKLPFSNDTYSTLGTGLSAAVRLGAAMANSGTAGYFAGGYASGSVTTVDKFAFSNDARSTLGTGLSAATYAGSGYANTGVAGYFCGGTSGSNTDKFAFSNDSRSTGTTLSSSRDYMGTAANESSLA